MSEIDLIFSSKAKSKQKKKHSSTLLPESKSVESSSKKRPLPETVVDPSADLPGSSKRRRKDKSPSKKPPLPETVVDTSADLLGPSKRRKKDSTPNKNSKLTKAKSEPTGFGDSRGSGDRRRTEEGWSVYKEAELGLNDIGGDTPSCPFDCNCCF